MKHTNEQTFGVNYNGNFYLVTAYCYRKGYDNYESVQCRDLNIRGSYSYQGRPWQTCRYSSALWELCSRIEKKFGADMANAFREQTLNKVEREAIEEADAMFGKFEKAYNASSPETKKMLAESEIEVHSAEDVESVTTMINGLNALNTLMA